jgi:hypothetical protein
LIRVVNGREGSASLRGAVGLFLGCGTTLSPLEEQSRTIGAVTLRVVLPEGM